ncbi:MAG: nucleotidyltransferase [Lachnospiraceae bacterium]|nr:nucleotidyltransferase [Lachnospiraceae bacterium]
MNKPVLVIMAAGMGSRYGGLKQIDPVDGQGNKIIDFSIYDALQAGFEKIIFVIKKEHEADFRACISDRIGNRANILYAYQELTTIPEGFSIPEGRVKPWGTGHAMLSAASLIDAPFAVINADDYYGREAFKLIYDYLSSYTDKEKYCYAMVGYELQKTLTENGSVSRGVCETDADGYLTDIVERTSITWKDGGIVYTEDGKDTPLPTDSTVSMNMWGFGESILREAKQRFIAFFKENVPANPLKSEFFLPFIVDAMLKEDRAEVKVLKTKEKWFGVTYQEDKPFVQESIRRLKAEGVYPEVLWD